MINELFKTNSAKTQATGRDINVRANNITICYDDLGKGAIPIIFIHGFPFDKSMWQPQMEELKSQHRVIAYDIRGFGKSGNDSEELSMGLFSEDLIAFMDALQIGKAVICGLSMGGYIALNAINRFSDRFEGLILCDTQCIADSPEGKQKRYKTIEHIQAGGLNDFAEGFVKNVFYKESFNDKAAVIEKIKCTILSTSLESITGTLVALAEREATCTSFDAISVPTLIICGREDVVTPPVQSEHLQSGIKNSWLQIIDRAGHLSNLEQPEEFNKHLQHYLSSFARRHH
ncbi:MAG TPA: alpha/beta fold hydrolase [Bacteroidia bacterium]|jgi:pimeloyl-ACP methyl ester carboxylesterase